MKNSKITKEYDVNGANPFSIVLAQREHTFLENVSLMFSRKWYNIKHKYYAIKLYFKNLVFFNKVAKNYYPWDYQSQVNLFAFGLERLAKCIENGHEVEWSSNKKVAAIHELVDLLKRGYEDEVDDKYLGVGQDNVITHVKEYEDGSIGFETIDEESKKILESTHNIYVKELKKARDAYYDRIFYLIRGQKLEEQFEKQRDDENLEEYNKRWDKFNKENFDGSGIEGWWD